MENASKALIMAAEVLIGVIVISIGVTLFSMFQNYSKETVDKLNESKISEFNNNFTKYDGQVNKLYYKPGGTYKEVSVPIRVTAHDIITMANYAKENNKYYDLESEYSEANLNNLLENTLYVSVNKGMERWEPNQQNQYIDSNSLIYITGKAYHEDGTTEDLNKTPFVKCFKVNCSVNVKTGRVNKVVISEFGPEDYKNYYNLDDFDKSNNL